MFNLDESVTEMVRDPKFLAGMASSPSKKAFRRNKLPIVRSDARPAIADLTVTSSRTRAVRRR